MALNLSDKYSLSKQILPEIDFVVTSAGVTLSSERLNTPRFLPFDHPGKCRECKSSDVDLDFVVCKEGVSVFCNRIKGSRFVQFDFVHDLPGHCFFKIRSKGRVFNVQHGKEAVATSPIANTRNYRQMPIMHYLSNTSENNHASKTKLTLEPEPWELEDGNALMEPPIKVFKGSQKTEQSEVQFVKEIKKEVPPHAISERQHNLEERGKEVQFIKEVKKETPLTPPPQLQYMGFAEQQQPLEAPAANMTATSQSQPITGQPSDEYESNDEDEKFLEEFFDKMGAATYGVNFVK